MTRLNPHHHLSRNRWRRFWRSMRPSALGLVFALAVVGPLTTMSLLLPLPLVLPAFGVWSLAFAGLMALFAWYYPRPRAADVVNAWDLAGAFTLIGCAAAILGEIEYMLDFIWPLSPKDEAHD
jgi:hypothetical protein